MITIKQIEVAKTYPLRLSILRPGLTLSDCQYNGDEDPLTAHLGAYHQGELVSILSIYHCPLRDEDGWRIRGMATAEHIRNKGIATKLLGACTDYVLDQQGDTMIWCTARTSALTFYKGLGFKVEGEEFTIKGVGPHYIMINKKPRRRS